MTRALVFPGQGSQAIGMGRDVAGAFATARDVFAEIDEALHQNLSRLMFEGPEDDLTLTENAQPALMAASLAVARVLEKDGKLDLKSHVAFVAGHSLGEYSALAAAHALALADAARLLKRRGQAMQRAVPVGMGAMAAMLGAELDLARDVAKAAAQNEVCDLANDNGGGQLVLSGHKTAIERAVAIAAERGVRRSIMLPVSAPFHCALMQPAADEMADALGEVKLGEPWVPLIANVCAAPVRDPDEIKRLLVEQVTGLVRWRECVLAMKEQGVHELIELGAGKVLTGLTKRIDKELTGQAIGTPTEIEAFLKTM
ncbi:MAG TPA: ACP S-malonyltransferase [Stellaceae bacterium]|jgi:[acyl-carrier-protein] S-malonyltransferase|nr:ACP S-malonyltransferase [Stellaceae bacterium]